MICLVAGCLRPVCDEAAGGCPHARDAGTHHDAGPTGECTIGGTTYAGGEGDPENACRVCVPENSPTSWTDLPDGTHCSVLGDPRICFQGSCRAGCFIDGGFFTPGQKDPPDVCAICQPDASTTDWTHLNPDVCPGNAHCSIGDVSYPIGARDPEDPSKCCTGDWVPRLQDGGTYQLGVHAPRVTAIALGDLNQDGNPDLVFSFVEMGVDRPSALLGVMLGQLDGTFGPVMAYPACFSEGLAVGDLTGDSYPDVVTGTCSDGSIIVFLNSADGTGVLRPGTSLAFKVPLQASAFPLEDFDGDRKLDLILGGQDAYFLKGLGNGRFADPVGYAFPVPPVGATSVVGAAFRGDGVRDFVAGTRSNAAFNIFLGGGDGSFLAQSTVWNGFANLGLAAGEFDGDGRTDLAFGGSDRGNPLSIVLGNGDGTFSVPSVYPSVGFGLVALADLDHDGRCEALVAAADPSSALNVLWHFQDGGTTATTIPLDQPPSCIVAGEIGTRGGPSVAIGTGSAIQIYTNACPGNFAESHGQF
jgi:hypothetical protein